QPAPRCVSNSTTWGRLVVSLPAATPLRAFNDEQRRYGMLLTITAAFHPATDLGYVLCKNPGRTLAFELSFGKAQVFFPQADEDQCTAALLLEIDPVGLARHDGPNTLYDYVNDRPYVCSSFLSVAISRVFGTALQGKNKEKPELSAQAIPLTATITALPCRRGA